MPTTTPTPTVDPQRASNLDRLMDRIVDAFAEFDDAVDVYPWIWEDDRWYQLVFSLLVRIGQPELSALTAQDATLQLRNQGLLEVDTLAQRAPVGEADFDEEPLSDIMAVLQRLGFTTADAKTAAATLCDVARGLSEQYDGKVQKYLRHYGQLMIQQLPDHFTFSHLDEQEVRYAFTHWLQQVINMPLGLSNPSLEMLCERYGVPMDALVEEADQRDLNVAFLDELATELAARDETGSE